MPRGKKAVRVVPVDDLPGQQLLQELDAAASADSYYSAASRVTIPSCHQESGSPTSLPPTDSSSAPVPPFAFPPWLPPDVSDRLQALEPYVSRVYSFAKEVIPSRWLLEEYTARKRLLLYDVLSTVCFAHYFVPLFLGFYLPYRCFNWITSRILATYRRGWWVYVVRATILLFGLRFVGNWGGWVLGGWGEARASVRDSFLLRWEAQVDQVCESAHVRISIRR